MSGYADFSAQAHSILVISAMSQIHVFAGNPLDRAANHRRDAAWLKMKLAAPETRFLPLWRLNALLSTDDKPTLVWLTPDVVAGLALTADPILLGLAGDGAPRFAIDVSTIEAPEAHPAFGGAFVEVRAAAQQVTIPEAGILAQARTLVDWHRRHSFCAVCGAPTAGGDGGYMRVCRNEACKAQHFPRTDPVIITLVTRPGFCLLGRSARFPTQTYSALAGFMEPGESIEEAVRREVLEESGIEVGAVRYHSSQPWPFPASLMIGCMAEATTQTITVDPVEIEDARWYSLAQVRRALDGDDPETGLKVPQPLAIAHQLIRAWVSTSPEA